MSLTIIDLFNAQVLKKPHDVALVSGGRELTYSSLNDSINQVAHFLRDRHKVNRGARVAFSFSQKPSQILSVIMAILRLGAIYIPIDSKNQEERINYLLEQAQPDIVVTDSETYDMFKGKGVPVVVLEDNLVKQESSSPLQPLKIDQDDIAYIIFTSGSTGDPKGVQVMHRNLIAAYFAWEGAYDLGNINCHLQVVGYGFDVFCGDWIRSLCSGSKLVMCPEEITKDEAELYKIISDYRVECAEFLPSALRGLASYCSHNSLKLDSFKLLICGSDSWYVDEYFAFKELLGFNARLINSYGTSETTIDTSFFEFTEDNLFLRDIVRQVPIGRPFLGMSIHVVSKDGYECLQGEVGEIYIGGSGVSRGYINAPDLNKRKFTTNINLGKGVFYRTGDYGVALPTGDIELAGRNDLQIKHKGRRVNLTEIERSVQRLPFVKECAIVVGDKDIILTCYVTLNEQYRGLSELEVCERATLSLPPYLVPDIFRILSTMPTNTSGKINRRTLRAASKTK